MLENLKTRFAAYDDLAIGLSDSALDARIDVPKHKSLKEHLWCVVGARESHADALEAGVWQGFNCSMTAYSADDFRTALTSSADRVVQVAHTIQDWTDEHDRLLATICEHEVMHEGQIIRHVYAMNETLPASWKWA
ncbi:MAG TPA: hypothetical protein DD437_12455 [Rhodobiaceae bacterium]|nr:hypothetical protein [Rhodobiaceae bacterium]